MSAKWKESMIKKLGSEQAYKQWVVDKGRKGGLAKHNGNRGFASNPDLARIAGSKGGKVKRVKNNKKGNV